MTVEEGEFWNAFVHLSDFDSVSLSDVVQYCRLQGIETPSQVARYTRFVGALLKAQRRKSADIQARRQEAEKKANAKRS